jgi:formate hydrogenlyase subunit 4
MKFAMFFMAEYTNMVTVACVATTVFLGGWHGPAIPWAPAMVQGVLPLFWFLIKVFFFLFLYIWVRGTLPRFRYDQLMALAGRCCCRWPSPTCWSPTVVAVGSYYIVIFFIFKRLRGGSAEPAVQRHPSRALAHVVMGSLACALLLGAGSWRHQVIVCAGAIMVLFVFKSCC